MEPRRCIDTDTIWTKIQTIAEKSNGFVKTSDIEAAGISRPMLKKYVDMGKLDPVRKGLYTLTDEFTDEFALLQAQSAKIIYSYGTALFFWGMSDRAPNILDITLPRGTNISRLRRDNPNLRCHYVQTEVYDLGITDTKSPQGGMVKLYDRERCICDVIRDKDQIELQLFTQAIKDYFKTNPNNRKLLKYGKVFGIEDKIRTYMEVL